MEEREDSELELACFEIIAQAGTAKSLFVEAVTKAEEGDFDAAESLLKEGDGYYLKGHDAHMRLLQKDAAGESDGRAPLILLHAEDQMANSECVRLLAESAIKLYRRLFSLESKLA